MNKISEEIQIMIAASIVGKDAPELLSETRARQFVFGTLDKSSTKRYYCGSFRSLYVWGGLALAAAICVAAVFLFSPSASNADALVPKEIYSVHASSAVVDSLAVGDTVELNVLDTEVVE